LKIQEFGNDLLWVSLDNTTKINGKK